MDHETLNIILDLAYSFGVVASFILGAILGHGLAGGNRRL